MRLISKLFNRQYFNQLAIFTMLMAVTPMAIAQQVSVSTKKTASKYLNSILPEAERIQKQYGIPLDLTLAIARQESGNWEYIIGKGNHFGLRCDSDDCITLEKNGQMISYETCPDVSECFNIFAESIKALSDGSITPAELYERGYATSFTWVKKVNTIQKEVQQTLSAAGIKY